MEELGATFQIISYVALFGGLFIFALNKANVDALKEQAATYKGLYEAEQAKNDELTEDKHRLLSKVNELEAKLDTKDAAQKRALDELIEAFKRSGGGFDIP